MQLRVFSHESIDKRENKMKKKMGHPGEEMSYGHHGIEFTNTGPVYLKKMVKLFDEGKLKVCVDEHFAFDEVKEALSKSLTARSGGKLVIDVASPAPSETCCVVA